MMSNDFELSFANFLEDVAYDKASDALFVAIRAAYLAGWKAAGGKEPQTQKIFTRYYNAREEAYDEEAYDRHR